MNVNAGQGRKHVSMWHIFHEMIPATRVRLIDLAGKSRRGPRETSGTQGRNSLDDQEYGNVYVSAECVYLRGIFLEMILAARSSLDDQEYGNLYESAESVYPRGIFLEMILAARSSLDDQEYGNVYESAESVYPYPRVAYSIK